MHQNIRIISLALNHALNGRTDADGMVTPVEVVVVDDATWVRIHNFDSGFSQWVAVFGRDPAHLMARTVGADEVEETDLDEWRV